VDRDLAKPEPVSPDGPLVVLEVTAGPHRGLKFEYAQHDTLLVGRGTAANLQLIDDPHFSRHHFLLEFNPPRVYLRDLGSSNGTRVNGKPVTESFLAEGDEIAGGKTRIRVSLPGKAAALTLKADPPPTASRVPSAGGSVGFGLPGATAVFTPAPPTEDLPNYIPGYEVFRKLGAGGMGAVYLARHRGDGREYAVKLMLPESAASERAMRLFLREVSVLSKLDHPNVVRYHEMGSALGQFYFVMEYVPSISLREQAADLPPEQRVPFVCTVAAQALDGLTYAHAQGFVHRDFKPANLLVAGDVRTPRVKVSDFGLAKSFQNAGFSGMTMSGHVMGTLAFMAPEQLTHCRDVKPPADLYSVGASTYSLLAGKYPLDVRPGRDPVRTLLEDEPTPLRSVCEAVPVELARVVHRALQKNPADRFPDAAAMRAALRPFATGG
jgi:serine/threonine-protein kinase